MHSIFADMYFYQNLQVTPSDLEGNFSIFFRRSFFPRYALGMPSFNNSVVWWTHFNLKTLLHLFHWRDLDSPFTIAGGHYSSMLLMSYSLRSFFDQIGIWHFFDALRIGFDFQQDFALFDLFWVILNTKVLKCLNQCFARLRS